MSSKNIFNSITNVCILGVIFVSLSTQIQSVYALALTTLSDTQSSLKAGNLSDHTIQLVTQSGVSAGQAISVTFPAGYATGTFAITNFDFATSTSASCSSFTDAPLVSGAASGLSWGVTVATSTLYITSGTAVIPANRCVQIRIGSNAVSQGTGVSVITNPPTPAIYSINVAGSFGDTGYITEHIITDDTVSMTGTIVQSLTFSISTSTIFFGTLSAAGTKFASSTNQAGDTIETVAHTLSVGTNAPSGFTLSVRGQTLTSQQNISNTITQVGVVAASSTAGTEQFGIRATESGGIGTAVSAPFDMATSYGYGATASSSEILATGSGSTPTSTFSLRYATNISAVTEAGTYAADLVYVATANF
jgi:hypothetical protein